MTTRRGVEARARRTIHLRFRRTRCQGRTAVSRLLFNDVTHSRAGSAGRRNAPSLLVARSTSLGAVSPQRSSRFSGARALAVLRLVTFATLLRPAQARPELRVRADVGFTNVGVVRSESGTDIAGGLRDDAGQPVPDADVWILLSPTVGAATTCPRGARVTVEGSKAFVRTDSLGSFCVRLPANAAVEGLTVNYGGDRYLGAATGQVPLVTGHRRLSLAFDRRELVASLDETSFVASVDATVADGFGVGDPVRLVLWHQPDPATALETEVAATDVQVGGRARFDVETRLLGAPGAGRLVVRFSGSAEFAPAEDWTLLERRATAQLTLGSPLSPSDPSEGVELQIGVSSPKTGAVGSGWVEAVSDGQTVGIAPVAVGAARLVATFTPPRGRPATLSVRYVPEHAGFVAGEPITVTVPIRPVNPWGGAPWLVGAAGIAYWVIRAWRRPARAARARPVADSPASGRAEALLLERDAAGSGWRGHVIDAHDGTPVEGARVTLVVPVFDGEGVAATFTTAADGAFAIAHVAAAKQEGARLVAAARHHTTLAQPVPPDGMLAVCLVSRRRALLDRLVGWARRAGRPWVRRRGGEPTPLDVADAARHFNQADVTAWASAVEEAAYGAVPPDERKEDEIVAREPTVLPAGQRGNANR
jgi:hypothetical protein